MPIFLAVLAMALVARAEPTQHHVFSGLAISPSGDRAAVLEADQRDDAGEEAYKRLVIRAATNGTALATFDPCATRDYHDPMFSPDGQRIAVLGHDRAAGTTTLYLADRRTVRLASR